MANRKRRSPKRTNTPPPRDLTRTIVVKAALNLLDREGSDTLTMRTVADSLGVTPMALYNHVSSKDDLLRAIAAHVLEEAEFDSGNQEWRAQVEFCFRELRAICLRHPSLARLLETADVAPAAVFAPMEVTLKALKKAGLAEVDALRAYFTLVGFSLAQASYQSRGPYADLEPSERIRTERLAGRGYRTVENLSLSDAWDFDAAFEFGLRLILDGVELAAARVR